MAPTEGTAPIAATVTARRVPLSQRLRKARTTAVCVVLLGGAAAYALLGHFLLATQPALSHHGGRFDTQQSASMAEELRHRKALVEANVVASSLPLTADIGSVRATAEVSAHRPPPGEEGQLRLQYTAEMGLVRGDAEARALVDWANARCQAARARSAQRSEPHVAVFTTTAAGWRDVVRDVIPWILYVRACAGDADAHGVR